MRLVRLPGVFQPISDSWMLAAMVAHERLDAGSTALDLCTGSGMLAVAAALRGAGSVVAVDVSRRALLSAKLNAAVNGVRVQTRRGDLFAAVPGRRFDLIVSNPPYVPSASPGLPSRGPARAWDAGPDGRAFLDRVCSQVAEHLRPGGVLLMCQSAICGESETLDALRARGLAVEVAFRHAGVLGPRLREREQWLRRTGLLTGDRDEVIVVRAQRPYREDPRTTRAGAAGAVPARS